MRSRKTNQQKIISEYGEGPNLLEDVLAGLSEADLDQWLQDDSWTIRQIVHHISDGDDIWKSFIKQAIGDPGGEFILHWYWQMAQDKWAERWKYKSRSISSSLALFRANRNHIVQLLEHAPHVLENCLLIRWPRAGEQDVSISWVLEMQSQHVQEHVEDIREIRELHGM
ncbi:MAG: DUF664 domain-containing protein [candidate division Zixibacteria bacterium]|nr:DUF664 domain-containing protein [candidate division Zixibacteria bacterium]